MNSPFGTDLLSRVVVAGQDLIESVARGCGRFDKVQTHEPKSTPGSGVTWACWLQDLRPLAAKSGLNVTSARIVFQTRIYTNMFADNPDMIDVRAAAMASEQMAAYNNAFSVRADGEEVGWIDLLGESGDPPFTRAAYINQDGKLHRVLDTFVPVIAPDVFVQNHGED